MRDWQRDRTAHPPACTCVDCVAYRKGKRSQPGKTRAVFDSELEEHRAWERTYAPASPARFPRRLGSNLRSIALGVGLLALVGVLVWVALTGALR